MQSIESASLKHDTRLSRAKVMVAIKVKISDDSLCVPVNSAAKKTTWKTRGSQTHSVQPARAAFACSSSAARMFPSRSYFPIKVQSRDIYVYASFPARSAAVPLSSSPPLPLAARRLVLTVARTLKIETHAE